MYLINVLEILFCVVKFFFDKNGCFFCVVIMVFVMLRFKFGIVWKGVIKVFFLIIKFLVFDLYKLIMLNL